MDTIVDPIPDPWTVAWRYGPDAGARRVLAAGRYVVGRAATADIRCDDPALDRHEGTLEIDPEGTAVFHHFTGRRTEVGADGMSLGASTLTVECGRPAAPEHATVVDGCLVRRPRVVPRLERADVPEPPPMPTRAERPGGLLPALLGLVGAGSMALLLHQPMFLVFGAVGSSVAVGSWCTQRLAARRRHRRLVDDHRRASAEREAVLRANHAAARTWHIQRIPTLQMSLAAGTALDSTLWSRRAHHEDAFVVGIGDGQVRDDDGSSLGDLPVAASLDDGACVAIIGDEALAVARAIVAQLTASCGPADVRIVVVTDRPMRWEVLAPLPHLVLPDATPAIVDEQHLPMVLELLGPRERARLLVVTDCARALATRTSPLRRLLGASNVAVLGVLGDDDGVPHMCTAVLRTQGATGSWTADTSTDTPPTPVRIAALGAMAAATHAHALAGLRDPEDGLAGDTRLPRQVALLEMIEPLGTDPAREIARRWLAAAHRPPCTPIGIAADGLVDVDLVRDGPHGLLAGTTGSGKSELLRTLVAGLALHTPPDRLAIVLVDYKGGATFDALVRLPHVVGVITDLEGALADRALRSLHAELRRREAVLREHGVVDLAALHEHAPTARLPRLLVVIDEFAALVAEQPDFLHALVGVAQRGRSLGVHLLLATQRPHGVISDDIRANTDLRIALRLLDRADALDVVGDSTPAALPRTVPGRGVMRLGADEHVTFQTARLPQADIGPLVDQIVAAAALTDAVVPNAPWLPPLPRRLRATDLPQGVIGLCDDPDHQSQVPMRWSADDGDLLVVGSPRMGRSSALRWVIAAALADPDCHLYVLHADTSCEALPEPHRRALRVHVGDRERLVRLLHRLRHTTSGGTGTRTILVVDGLDEVRRVLDDPGRSDEYDDLDAVLADPGIALVLSASRPAAVPASVVTRCARRWVLHCHDPHEATVLGVPAAANPPAIEGRVHIVPEGLAAQLALPTRRPKPDTAHGAATTRAVAPIDPVPAILSADTLDTARRDDVDGTDIVPMGMDCVSGSGAVLEVPEGEHVLVLGGARSGRSTTLTRIVSGWRALHPEGEVLAVLPRRSGLDRRLVDRVVKPVDLATVGTVATPELPRPERTLVVIDDAELVDDPDGVLAALATSRRPGITIVAAARPDAIRQAYGHWTGVVRRSRLGLVATGGGDTDGDVLGAALPRRAALPSRPGLMWLVDRGRVVLVQVAVDTPSFVDGLRTAN